METEFEPIIKENAGVLHKLCRIYTFNADEYDELFQEMLVQIWLSNKNFRGEAKISTFIYRICINTALGFRAKIVRRKKLFEPLDGKIFIQPAPDSADDEQLEKLYAAIRELKPVDRAIISLYLDDKSYDETASILGISKTNVATRLMRLKKNSDGEIVCMNEKDLKNLWQSGQTAPEIDFVAAEKLLSVIQNRLSRNIRIEIWLQITVTASAIIPVFVLPRLIFFSVLLIVLCVWYVRELRTLYKPQGGTSETLPVKNLLLLKSAPLKISNGEPGSCFIPCRY